MDIREFVILWPFDGHNHFRDGDMLKTVAHLTAEAFPRGAVAMPNLDPPIVTPQQALEYKERIWEAVGYQYPLIMTGYLQEDMDPQMVADGFTSGAWQAMKFYPRGMTTNSHGGVEDITKLAPVFEAMQDIGMPALFHGESAKDSFGKKSDIYDREKHFFENEAKWLIRMHPRLKKSFEHGSTRAFVTFMLEHGSDNTVGTITNQHLLFDRNDFFANGPDVHLHCYPVLKRFEDKKALRELATSGKPYIFAGTDSAPHPTTAKERACGCAGGVFTAHAAPELYIEVFEEEGKLGNLEGFLCINGPRFYKLPENNNVLPFVKERWTVYEMVGNVRPLFYHEREEGRRPILWKRK